MDDQALFFFPTAKVHRRKSRLLYRAPKKRRPDRKLQHTLLECREICFAASRLARVFIKAWCLRD